MDLGFFTSEDLDEQCARHGQRFREHAGELARASLHNPLESLARPPDAPRARHEQRQETDRDDRKAPVEREDEDEGAREHDRILGEIDQRVADDAAHALDIVEHMAHRFARLLLREEIERHVVQLAVDRDAEVDHHLLTDALGVVLLHDLEQAGRERSDHHARAIKQ